MKILLVIRWPVGGIRTYLKYMLNDQALNTHTYTLILPDIAPARQLQESLRDVETKFIFVGEQRADFLNAIKKEIAINKCDVLHAHGCTAGVWACAVRLLRATPPIIVSAHDVFHEHHFSGVKGFFKKNALKFMFKSCKYFNVLGSDAESNVYQYFPTLKKEKVRKIRNGVDTYKFHEASSANLRQELNIPSTTFLIGFLGRFMGQKGFRYLFEAIKKLNDKQPKKDFVVVCVGAGEGFESRERKAIIAAGLDQHFRFIPFSDNIGGVLKDLDVLVMPSVWECCPLMPMEALSAGTPIITSDCIGMAEIVAGTPALTFESKNSDALLVQIQSILNNPQLRLKFQTFSVQATNQFNVHSSAIQLDELYKDCV